MWKWLVAYFDGGISLETPLDSQQQYIFCSFPHGTCTASHLLTMTNGCGMLDKVHGGDRRDLCATVLFFVPIFREILLWLGCVDAGTRTAHHNLKCGRSILIFVGGEKEQLMTTPGVHQIFLNNRKGFVKLALEYGSPLVPMYAFGENEVFHVSKLFMGTSCYCFIFDSVSVFVDSFYTATMHDTGFRVWLQHKFQLGIPLLYGRWGLFPLKVRIHVEVGKPLLVAKKRKEDITQADIDALHAKFVQSMQDLFERTKFTQGCTPDTKLIIH
jgi:1-acyl-sn-glycerol-3-phosphate acyltransferase